MIGARVNLVCTEDVGGGLSRDLDVLVEGLGVAGARVYFNGRGIPTGNAAVGLVDAIGAAAENGVRSSDRRAPAQERDRAAEVYAA